jgi:hypothetical protein
MFEERKISTKEALRLACEANGLKYVGAGNRPQKTITLVDDNGNKTVVDRNFNIIDENIRKDCNIKEVEAKQIKCKKYNFEIAKENMAATNGSVGRLIRKVYGEHNYIKVKPRKRNTD